MHDLHYPDLLLIDFSMLDQLSQLENDKLVPIAEAYKRNFRRVDSLLQTPSVLLQIALNTQYCRHLAFFEKHGRLPTPADSNDPQIAARAAAIHEEKTREEKSHLKDASQKLLLDFGRVDFYAKNTQLTFEGIEGILTSSILNAWTAFETLSSDLWEAAVNFNPGKLATLTGSPNRINQRVAGSKSDEDDRPDDPAQSLLLADISKVTRGTFDLRGKIGALLLSRFKFQKLSGIRVGYSRAFKNQDSLDSVLSDNCLDALSTIRNVIVHRAGIADSDYELKCKLLTNVPKLKSGDPIQITGALCASLISPVVACGSNLIMEVEKALK